MALSISSPLPADRAEPLVEVRRSARRRRTVSAYRDGDRIVVLLPQRFTRAEEARWVAEMVADVQAREERARRRGPRASDAALARRARELTAEHLPADVWPVSIRWVSTMGVRWASCTPSDRTIRVSDRLRDAPGWVLDYVIVHELAHVLVAGHDADFWALVERYPRSERARGYLEGVTAAERQPTELVPEATEGDDEQPSDTLF
ncbi:MAG: M48 metallopeptidase family protein [Jatrophihabitans sp.]